MTKKYVNLDNSFISPSSSNGYNLIQEILDDKIFDHLVVGDNLMLTGVKVYVDLERKEVVSTGHYGEFSYDAVNYLSDEENFIFPSEDFDLNLNRADFDQIKHLLSWIEVA